MKEILNSYFLQNSQNKYHDSKSILPILLEIIEDLEILEQAFIFRGIFCPLIEYKAPDLALGNNQAQRSHQFHMIGRRIIKNCRSIIYLTPSNHLPLITQNCQQLISFFLSKKSEESKTFLEIQTNQLMTSSNMNFEDMINGLRTYRLKFDVVIPQELPALAHRSWIYSILPILGIIFLIKLILSCCPF